MASQRKNQKLRRLQATTMVRRLATATPRDHPYVRALTPSFPRAARGNYRLARFPSSFSCLSRVAAFCASSRSHHRHRQVASDVQIPLEVPLIPDQTLVQADLEEEEATVPEEGALNQDHALVESDLDEGNPMVLKEAAVNREQTVFQADLEEEERIVPEDAEAAMNRAHRLLARAHRLLAQADLEEEEPLIPDYYEDKGEPDVERVDAIQPEDEPMVEQDEDEDGDQMKQLDTVLAQSLAPLGPNESLRAQAQRLDDLHSAMVARTNARCWFIDVDASVPGKPNEVFVITSDED